MHLVGFIIRVYHDARSLQRQIRWWCWVLVREGLLSSSNRIAKLLGLQNCTQLFQKNHCVPTKLLYYTSSCASTIVHTYFDLAGHHEAKLLQI